MRADIVGAVYTHEFSLLTNHLAIDGAFTIAAAGTFNTTLAGTALTQYGHITATGAANIGTGIGVQVTVPAGTYIPLGTLFDVVNATGAITADIIPTITTVGDTNPLYTFDVEPITGTAAGKLTIKTTGTPIQPADPVPDPVANAAAPALGALPATAPVIIAINALTTPGAVASAEAQLAPSTASLASPLLTFQGVREFQTLWLNRLDACGQVSWPSENKENCKGSTADNGWWLKGFGYFGHQDSRSGFTSYDASILGSMIAYDRSLGLNTRAGVGLGYARTNIQGKVYDANTQTDTYRAVAYIGHEFWSWFVDASGSFGWNEYRDRRHVEFPGMDTTAKAKYDGQDYTAFGRVGYHLPAFHEFIATPMASLQYTRINISGRTEKGSSDDINMKVRSQRYDYLESGLGAKVERPFNYNSKFTFVPEAHFEWLHKLSNPRIKQTTTYVAGSDSFTTPSLRTVADSYRAGVGLNLLSCACSATIWSVEAGYDYYWRTDGYAANQVSMRVSRRF
ncbi:MAG: autotransporter domain-containing protein [Candidatus Omnitrophota bacterium]|nr:autotransporter domain-containing protein [Candidatus Omnitrophota bacterium]